MYAFTQLGCHSVVAPPLAGPSRFREVPLTLGGGESTVATLGPTANDVMFLLASHGCTIPSAAQHCKYRNVPEQQSGVRKSGREARRGEDANEHAPQLGYT